MRVTYLPEPDEFLVELQGREVVVPHRQLVKIHNEIGIALSEADGEYEAYEARTDELNLRTMNAALDLIFGGTQ